MDNREFVFKITEIVYKHLGNSVSSDKIKNVVRELLNVFPEGSPSSMTASSPELGKDTAIVTAFGKSHPGIVAGITAVLAEANADITDITQTLLGKNFAMIVVVDISACSINFTELKERLVKKGDELGTSVFAQHEGLFKYMHRV